MKPTPAELLETKAENLNRARRLSKALAYYKNECLSEPGPVDDFSLIDLLSDARHYCDEQALDYAVQDRAAYANYSMELRGGL